MSNVTIKAIENNGAINLTEILINNKVVSKRTTPESLLDFDLLLPYKGDIIKMYVKDGNVLTERIYILRDVNANEDGARYLTLDEYRREE